jgi:ribosomal protein S19
MGRSSWKGPLLSLLNTATNPPTASRNASILPTFVGKRFLVHNGKTYQNILITEQMVSRKFGEFAWTKKPAVYKKKDDNQKGKRK